MLQEIKAQVRQKLGPEPQDIVRYSEGLKAELRRKWQTSSKAELLLQIEQSDLVYGGDFHAHVQVQRTHLRILRSLGDDRPVVLALEAFSVRAQKHLQDYLKGMTSLEDLRRLSRWDKNWGFPWEHYRPLLELAKQRGFHLLALNDTHEPTARALQQRDQKAARHIRKAYLKYPGALIYVIIGDLHLAPNHLPREVRRMLPRARLRETVIFINPEKIYFQLAKQGLENFINVVRLSKTQFAVISSPPWVQWQSYLMFLEQSVEEDLEDDFSDEAFDYTDHVAQMVQLACRDLNVKLRLDDLAVYSARDGRIWQILKKNLSLTEMKIAENLIKSGRSFLLPEIGVCYLSRASVNHAAELAGLYIHAKLAGRTSLLWQMPENFLANIWTEAVGFFMSKLVNHQRHGGTLNDLRTQLAFTSQHDQSREALLLAMDQRMSELIFFHQRRTRKRRLRPRRKASYFAAARILGAMMGERLYVAYRSRKLTLKSITQMMKVDLMRSDFNAAYFEWVSLLGPQLDAKKTRKERL